MIETYASLQGHYTALLNLVSRNPYEIVGVTYSLGRVQHDREVGEVDTANIGKEMNWLGLALTEINRRVGSKLIRRATICTTEVPQQIELMELFPNIKFRQHDANHAKIWVCKYKGANDHSVAMIGSRNITSTTFHEITVRLEGADAFAAIELAEIILKQSHPIDLNPDWANEAQELMDRGDL